MRPCCRAWQSALSSVRPLPTALSKARPLYGLRVCITSNAIEVSGCRPYPIEAVRFGLVTWLPSRIVDQRRVYVNRVVWSWSGPCVSWPWLDHFTTLYGVLYVYIYIVFPTAHLLILSRQKHVGVLVPFVNDRLWHRWRWLIVLEWVVIQSKEPFVQPLPMALLSLILTFN